MTLKETINTDFMEAYKSKNMEKKNFLGVLKGALQTQEGKQIESTDENVLKVIKSFEKGINETIEGKIKLQLDIEEQKLELSYLQPYLPTLMGEDEIRLIVKEIVSREDINKNQGFLMGLFNKEQKGKAFDNKTVSKIINKELA
ncbi:MAG: GatB/YqeY domain-containing protein [Bacteroidota bacterium]|jgi:uncharacterized protein YqeY